jgi:hypothetical protein
MDQCPHCGSGVADGPKCSNCGQSLEPLPEHGDRLSERVESPPTTAEQPKAEAEPRRPERNETPDGSDPAKGTDGALGGRISRRALLGGIGGSVAVLGAGGAGWWYLQSGEGRGVVESFVSAIASNNWTRIPDLYHDDAPLIQQIERSDGFDDYEGYLRQRERLETWEEIEPELESVEERYHVTEITGESVEEIGLGMGDDAVDVIDELREVIAFVSVSVGTINEERETAAEYYDDGTMKLPLPCEVVLADGSWQLWTARAGFFG